MLAGRRLSSGAVIISGGEPLRRANVFLRFGAHPIPSNAGCDTRAVCPPPTPDTRSAASALLDVSYDWEMNERQKLGNGQDVQNDRLWVFSPR